MSTQPPPPPYQPPQPPIPPPFDPWMELPKRVAGGDLAWMREAMAAGHLDVLREQMDDYEWQNLQAALAANDPQGVERALAEVRLPDGRRMADAVVAERRSDRPVWLWVVAGVLLAAAIGALVLWLSNRNDDELDVVETPTQNLVATLDSRPEYSTLAGLLRTAGLDRVLSETGPFTLFAPTNEAFARLPQETLDDLAANQALLTQVLTYHATTGANVTNQPDPGILPYATQLLVSGPLATLESQPVNVTTSGGITRINDATIIDRDLFATNGVIQGLDQVLVPPGVNITPPPPETTTTEATTTTLATTTTAATTTTTPPTTTTTTPATTVPPTTTPTTPPTTVAPPPTEPPGCRAGNRTVVQRLQDCGFARFAQLVASAGLDDELSTGQWTVFAPIDEAIEAIGPIPSDQIEGFVKTHLVVGPPVYDTAELTTGTTFDNENGQALEVTDDNPIAVDDVLLVEDRLVDIPASNGVVHGLNGVLPT